MIHADKLDKAFDLIGEAILDANTDVEECDACEHEHAVDPFERSAFEALREIMRLISRNATEARIHEAQKTGDEKRADAERIAEANARREKNGALYAEKAKRRHAASGCPEELGEDLCCDECAFDAFEQLVENRFDFETEHDQVTILTGTIEGDRE